MVILLKLTRLESRFESGKNLKKKIVLDLAARKRYIRERYIRESVYS
jgi:hypothetical protein